MAAGRKTGGRVAGTPNKSTKQVKSFLERVFGRAFTEAIPVHDVCALTGTSGPRMRTLEDLWVERILAGTMDEKFLQFLLTMHAGRPTQQVDVAHSGQVTLEQLITGNIPDDTPDES